jgi:hypothetical protein
MMTSVDRFVDAATQVLKISLEFLIDSAEFLTSSHLPAIAQCSL